jgi:hypothetical protein
MKKRTMVIVTILLASIFLTGIVVASVNTDVGGKIGTDVQNIRESVSNKLIKRFERLYVSFMKLALPKSLDKFYNGSVPEVPSSELVGEMFIMAGALDGMIANMQEGDMTNANKSYNVFAQEYKNVSKKVPEWRGYFDTSAVNKLGKDLNAGKINETSKDIEKVAGTCLKCMGERRAQVWAKFYWREFDTVNISGMPWLDGMLALGVDFGGIGANAAEGDKNATKKSFDQFKALYTDVKTACSNCHDTPRFYYVSDDVFAKIDQMGDNITSNNLQNVQTIQKELGIQCYRCHVLHMPAEDMKGKMS